MTSYITGIDENGLGPRLGPLVATAVTVKVPSYEAEYWRKIGISIGVTDSKKSSGFGQMRFAEGFVLAVMESLLGRQPRSYYELLAALSLDDIKILKAPCPVQSEAQCWQGNTALPAWGASIDQGRALLSKLEQAGLQIVRARSALACAGVLNQQAAQGVNRLAIDLWLFERLALDARASLESNLLTLCGMVGGIRSYVPRLRIINPDHVTEAKEENGISRYAVKNLGELCFSVDADAEHLPVAIASMIGKYLRELAMKQLYTFYAHYLPDLPEVSGYHDSRTRAFVQQTALFRKKRGVSSTCFER
ncbi:MAG: hypothetical protein IPJ88_14120 [Myxococcales bacterium]|nr:MAG: hypothetical protein IPJ88_14120 [Myxococcales bacterium]